jgi:hypothetical protein
MSVLPLSSSTQAELVMRTGPGPLRCEFEDNANGTVVYDNACNSVCFAEYRDSRVFDKYASNLIDQKNIRVRALEALISSECPIGFLRKISCSWNVGIICSRKNQ